GGSEPVIHQTSPLQVVPLQGTLATTAPLPHTLRLASPTLLEAVDLISTLLPIQSPLNGEVMLTLGPVPPPLETVTDTLVLAVWPVRSVAVRSGAFAAAVTLLVFVA